MAETTEGGRKLRAKERKHYTDMDIDEDDIDGKRNYNIEEKLLRNNFTGDFVQEMKGHEFNLKFIQENGLEKPIIFYDKTGLGMRVPSENFQVTDVKQCVGSRRMLDVMDVNTQKGLEMSMKEWVRYYQNPERDRLLNVISLEFSHTRLENYVESPTVVRQIDWVDRVWPRHLKECQTESTNIIDKMKYPKVQKYCLMSVAGCYTDFHIDFGGTSVWYHILHGEKVFWLIPPTHDNVERYVNWVLSAKQGDYFLADHMDQCQMLRLKAGYTFIIPSGWIHAVYTPTDSLVFGGNFLHSFNITNQLMAATVEDRTHVPQKFRYPFFNEILWYVLDRYLWNLTGKTYLQKPDIKDEPEDRPDSPNSMPIDDDSRPPSRNLDSRPPSRSLDDVLPSDSKLKPGGEETPKLSKSIMIELTRIDATKTTDGEYSKKLLKNCASDSSLVDRDESGGEEKENGAVKTEEGAVEGKPRKGTALTRWEVEGLVKLIKWVEGLHSLPPGKRGIPRDLCDPEALLLDIKQALKEHEGDNQQLACSGEPLLGWPESAKKHKQRLKGYGSSSGKPKAAKGASGSSSTIRRRRTRCKKCEPCTRSECGECTFCKDMRKFGGPGRMKQTCVSRQCMAPILPHMAVCMHCGLARRSDDPEPEDDNPTATLMECGICWEICHPACLRETFEKVETDGIINEDLPSSWECIKCVNVGKQGQLKPRVWKGPKALGLERRPSITSEHSTPSPPDPTAAASTPITLKEEEGEGAMSPTEGKRVTAKEQHKASPKERPHTPGKKDNRLLKKAIKHSMDRSKTSLHSSPSPSPSSTPLQLGAVKKQDSETEGEGSPAGKRPRREGPSRERELDPHFSSRGARGQSPSIKKLRPRRDKLSEEDSLGSTRASPTPGHSRWEGRHHHDDQKPGSSRQSGAVGSQASTSHSHGAAGRSRGGTPDKIGAFHGVGGQGSKARSQEEGSVAGSAEKDPSVLKQTFVVRPLALPPPPEQVLTSSGKPHRLERGLWMKVFAHLSPADLSRCLQVCKAWNRWCIHPSLWTTLNLSRTHIKQAHLCGAVLRQPRCLDLASAHISQRQLAWLLARLPQLKSLTLASQPWATICALCSPCTPLLRSLVLSWATGIQPACFQELVEPPVGVRPGLTPNLSRLHQLRHLDLSGTEVGDASLGLISTHMGLLESLDLRACMRVTDAGAEALVSQGKPLLMSLLSLNLCRCLGLTDKCFGSLTCLQRLRRLDLSRIPHITRGACYRFIQQYTWRPLHMASPTIFTAVD